METNTTQAQVMIDDALIAKWVELNTHGDYAAIGRICGKSRAHIMNVIKSKKASQSVFDTMKNFYGERSETLNRQKKDAEKMYTPAA